MLFDFFKKQTREISKIMLIKKLISGMKVPEAQKELYTNSLEVLDSNGLDKLYNSLVSFIGDVENTELKNIYKKNFSSIDGLRKKEAAEKEKEINSFSFLLNNI